MKSHIRLLCGNYIEDNFPKDLAGIDWFNIKDKDYLAAILKRNKFINKVKHLKALSKAQRKYIIQWAQRCYPDNREGKAKGVPTYKLVSNSNPARFTIDPNPPRIPYPGTSLRTWSAGAGGYWESRTRSMREDAERRREERRRRALDAEENARRLRQLIQRDEERHRQCLSDRIQASLISP